MCVGRPSPLITLRADAWEGPWKVASVCVVTTPEGGVFRMEQSTGGFVNGSFLREHIKEFECF